MPFGLGNIESRVFPRDPDFAAKVIRSSICIIGFGKALHWALMTL